MAARKGCRQFILERMRALGLGNEHLRGCGVSILSESHVPRVGARAVLLVVGNHCRLCGVKKRLSCLVLFDLILLGPVRKILIESLALVSGFAFGREADRTGKER